MPDRLLRPIEPATARTLVDRGEAVLIDVREADEHARERVEGARLAALSRFDPAALEDVRGKTTVFYCNSGRRTGQAAEQLATAGSARSYQLEGGLEAWRKAGLPVVVDRGAPLPIMRQVQIAAGSLVVLGVILGVVISPWFVALSAFVGTGLIMAGITGFCGMAGLLARMPWNRRAAAPLLNEGHAPAR